MKTSLFVILLATFTFIVTVACKTPEFGPTFPIKDFKDYEFVVVATVDHAVHSEKGYNGLETFDLTIKKCLKGNLKPGEKIFGRAKKEEPQAVCPVHLKLKEEYLLLLTKPDEEYYLSRFSFPIKKGYKYFDNYIKQIEKNLALSKNH